MAATAKGGGSGWRSLALFWAAAVVVVAAGAGALQYAGPPAPRPVGGHEAGAEREAVAPPAAHVATQSHDAAGVEAHGSGAAPAPSVQPVTLPGAIAAPDAALLEPAPDFRDAKLPRIGPDGRMAMRVYARPFDASDKRPKVAMLVAGLGLSDADSRAAVTSLPPAISLGVSPYSHDPEPLLAAARARGHEYFVTLPMESQGYPLNNSGVHALMTGVEPADNDRNLEWVLSRMQGEVGLTGASDGLRGERFAAAPGAIGPVLKQLADRGLMYVDPRPGAAPGKNALAGPVVTVTMVVDDVSDPAEIDARLQDLERRAHDGDRVVGLVGRVRPVTMERIANWARGLDGRGMALVPVSAFLPRDAAK